MDWSLQDSFSYYIHDLPMISLNKYKWKYIYDMIEKTTRKSWKYTSYSTKAISGECYKTTLASCRLNMELESFHFYVSNCTICEEDEI